MRKPEYMAYGKQGNRCGASAEEARNAFFAAFPKARLCDITEGESDGHMFFATTRGRRWKQVTKTTQLS